MNEIKKKSHAHFERGLKRSYESTGQVTTPWFRRIFKYNTSFIFLCNNLFKAEMCLDIDRMLFRAWLGVECVPLSL